MPLTQLVPGGMHPNKMINISGVPHPGAKRSVLGVEAVGGGGGACASISICVAHVAQTTPVNNNNDQ